MKTKETLKKLEEQAIDQYLRELDKTLSETTETIAEIINSLPEEARRPILATVIHKLLNKVNLDFYTKTGVLEIVKGFAQMMAYDTVKEKQEETQKQQLFQ